MPGPMGHRQCTCGSWARRGKPGSKTNRHQPHPHPYPMALKDRVSLPLPLTITGLLTILLQVSLPVSISQMGKLRCHEVSNTARVRVRL